MDSHYSSPPFRAFTQSTALNLDSLQHVLLLAIKPHPAGIHPSLTTSFARATHVELSVQMGFLSPHPLLHAFGSSFANQSGVTQFFNCLVFSLATVAL
jgi:hypothetical protein